MRRKVQLIAFALMIGGVSQITGCQPIQIPVPFTLNAALGGFEVEAGVPAENRGVVALGDMDITIGSGSIELDPDSITFVPANGTSGKGTVNLQDTTLVVTVSIATTEQLEVVCEEGEVYGPFEVTLDEDDVPVSISPSRVTLSQNVIDLLNGGEFSICLVVESPVDGTVTIDELILNLGL